MKSTLIILPLVCLLVGCGPDIKSKPFQAKRFVVTENLDPMSSLSYVITPDFQVNKDYHGPFHFLLEKGDDCLFFSGKDWEIHDRNAGMTYVPVVCSKKGAGWAGLMTVEKFQVAFESGKPPPLRPKKSMQ